MSDAIRPTGDSNTEREKNERKAADTGADKTTEQRDAEKASRESGTRTSDTKSGDSGIRDDKGALRGTGSEKEKTTTLGSDRTASPASTTDRAIPAPREGDPTTARGERTEQSASARPVHSPEPAPGVGSGNGRRVPQDAQNGSLLPHDESDKFNLRLQHAVTGFVDEPRSAVEEADHVLEEVAARFTEAVSKRRATLHGSWESKGSDGAENTEQLRLALRDYRELTERLLHM